MAITRICAEAKRWVPAPAYPDFLLRSTRQDRVCGFLQGKPHAVRQRHQPLQEIRRIRISCYAAPDRTACAAFFKESRMQFDNATNLYRKSGVPGTIMIGLQWFPRRVQPHLLLRPNVHRPI
jgi:hypothetical protein